MYFRKYMVTITCSSRSVELWLEVGESSQDATHTVCDGIAFSSLYSNNFLRDGLRLLHHTSLHPLTRSLTSDRTSIKATKQPCAASILQQYRECKISSWLTLRSWTVLHNRDRVTDILWNAGIFVFCCLRNAFAHDMFSQSMILPRTHSQNWCSRKLKI